MTQIRRLARGFRRFFMNQAWSSSMLLKSANMILVTSA
jgi:hypothetical protein